MKNKVILITVTLLALTLLSIIFLLPTNEAKAESNNTDGIKIKGSIEQTFKSIKDGNSALGQETNVEFSGKRSLDHGITASGAIRLEDSAIDKTSIKLAKGNFAIEFGADTGDNIHTAINPRVDDHPEDAGITGISKTGYTSFQAHDVQHVGLSYDTGVGKITVNYAPSNNPVSAGDGSTADNGGSARELVFIGNLGIDGAKFILGREIVASDTSTNGDQTETVYGAGYKTSNLAYGISYRTFDDKTSTTEVNKSLGYSVAYAINDNWTTGVERIQSSKKTAGTVDEEVMSYTVGYNLGGLGIALQYSTTDNVSGVSGTDNEVLQVRTVFAF